MIELSLYQEFEIVDRSEVDRREAVDLHDSLENVAMEKDSLLEGGATSQELMTSQDTQGMLSGETYQASLG